jgi:hypothetical protein
MRVNDMQDANPGRRIVVDFKPKTSNLALQTAVALVAALFIHEIAQWLSGHKAL